VESEPDRKAEVSAITHSEHIDHDHDLRIDEKARALEAA
jgi:hypothetical protein